MTITFAAAVLIMLLVRGQTTHAVPYYGVGVFLPIMVMAVRRHIKQHETGHKRKWGVAGATVAAVLAALVFVGQIAGKWQEGGWVVLISFSLLALSAHLLLLSPLGYREPRQIHRIVRDKARVQGAMASIVEWQSLKMQEYRYHLLIAISRIWTLFGLIRPVRYDPPVAAGDHDHAIHVSITPRRLLSWRPIWGRNRNPIYEASSAAAILILGRPPDVGPAQAAPG